MGLDGVPDTMLVAQVVEVLAIGKAPVFEQIKTPISRKAGKGKCHGAQIEH